MRTATPYCTPSQVKGAFPQIPAEHWGRTPLPDDAGLRAMIVTADSTVDDYCRSAYVVPFDGQQGFDLPSTITDLSLELVVIAVRRLLYGASPTEDAQLESRLKRVLSQLTAIGKGLPPVLDWPRQSGASDASSGGCSYSLPEDAERRHTMDWDP